jgi:hypothetical protein
MADEILRAESVQYEALFWKREAAAEDHEKYDKSMTAVGDCETNQVERVIANVLGHYDNEEHVASVPLQQWDSGTEKGWGGTGPGWGEARDGLRT